MKIIIDESSEDQRFDRLLRKYFKAFPDVSLTDIFSRIRKGAIKVNDRKRKENYRLQIEDIVSRDDTIVTDKNANDATRSKKQKIQHYPLKSLQKMIIHEDEHFLVFNKPSGIAMHPGQKHMTNLSLHDLMHSYLEQTEQFLKTETFSPSFCFRLDKDTSGIVIAAKSYPALQYLNELIRERQTTKTYIAVTAGHFPPERTITASLFKGYDRASGRGKMFINEQKGVEAKTTATCMHHLDHGDLGPISLVQVQLYTGRMHQIRIHLAHVGHPLIGDMMYGNAAINRIATKKSNISRQLLHSRTYGFFDKFSHKQVSFTAPVPAVIEQLFPFQN